MGQSLRWPARPTVSKHSTTDRVEAIKDYLLVKSVWTTPSPNRANPFVPG